MPISTLDQLNKDRQRLNTQGAGVAQAKANPSPSQARAVGVPPLTARSPMQAPQNKQQMVQGRPVFQSRYARQQQQPQQPQQPMGGGQQQPMAPAPLASTYTPPPPGPPPGQNALAPMPGDVTIPPPGSPNELPGAMTPEEQRNADAMAAIDEYMGGASPDLGLEVGDPYAIPPEMQQGQGQTDASMRDALIEAILGQLGMSTAQEEQQQIALMQSQLNDSVLGSRAGFGALGGFGGAIASGAAEGDLRRMGALEQGAAITDIRNAAADRAAQFGELALGQQGMDFDRELWGEYKAYLDQILGGEPRADTPSGGGGGGGGGGIFDLMRRGGGPVGEWLDSDYLRMFLSGRNNTEDHQDVLGGGSQSVNPSGLPPENTSSAIEVLAIPEGAQYQGDDGTYQYYKAADGTWYKVPKGSFNDDGSQSGGTVSDDGTEGQWV
jgi:hypothetical protein